MVVPEWIRSVRDGCVKLLARREPGEPTSVTKLFLCPDYTDTPTEMAAPRFLTLLTSHNGSFHTLIQEARGLDNPAAIAEIYHYRHLEDEQT